MQIGSIRQLTSKRGLGAESKKIFRCMRAPLTRVRHLTAAKKIPRNPEFSGLISEQRGFAKLPASLLPGMDKVVEFCQQIMEERRDKPELWSEPEHKHHKFPISLLTPCEKKDAPPIFDFVLSDPILQIASEYLGEVPVLQAIKVWWTPKNQVMQGSQFFHRDTLSWSERQVKFIFNMSEVDEEAGPFTFLPADVSESILEHYQIPPERLEDDEIFSIASPKDEVAVIGGPGSGYVVDSSRCFHFGSRCKGKERLVLVFNFRPYLSPDRKSKIPLVSEEFAKTISADPVRGIVYPVRTH